jgi:type III pantothenate kinase
MVTAMLITIDIGNTSTVIGLFKDEGLKGTWRVSSDTHRTTDEYRFELEALLRDAVLCPEQVRGACISSVVPRLTPAWEQVCRRSFNTQTLVVGPEANLGITLRYDNPQELGIDRALAAAAAYHRFKADLIVLDFGTATTIDYVSSQGEFMGGAIMPGLGTAADSLFEKTRQLPRVDYDLPEGVLGTNTVACLQIGILGGYCLMVEAMIARIKKQVQGSPRVVATGGLAPLITRHTNAIDTTDEHLILQGLKLTYELNH